MERVDGCEDCGAVPAQMTLTGVGTFCDSCADRRLAAITGFPVLPQPPAPISIDGPDGRRHRLRFRCWRTPGGISVQLEELDVDDGGYRFAVLGAHDTEVNVLVERVQELAVNEICRQYLHPASHRPGWIVAAGVDEVAGRFEFNPDGGPYRVAVDGRLLTWDELGEALEPYEGWRFRLVIEDPGDDFRPDAQVLRVPSRRHPSLGV